VTTFFAGPGVRRRIYLATAVAALFASSVPAVQTASAATAGVGAAAATCTYTVSPLPLPPGWVSGFPSHGDGFNLLTGAGEDAGRTTRPLLWRRGKVSTLPSPGGVAAAGADVNSDGVVVANTWPTEITSPVPFIVKGGRAIPLAVPPSAGTTIGFSINGTGLIVGYSLIGDSFHGIAWSADRPNRFIDLGDGDGTLFLNGLTESGVFVGLTQNANGDTRAVRGTLKTGLSTIPGTDPAQSSQAFGAAGRYVVGSGALPGTSSTGGLLWRDNTPVALPMALRAQAVNSRGLVAGFDGSPQSATAWQNGTSWTLPAPATDAADFGTTATEVAEDGRVFGRYVATSTDSVAPVQWSCV